MFDVNKIYKPLFVGNAASGKRPRYIIMMGGRSAGRSHAASQYALINLLSATYFRCAIMRFVLNDVRHSIWQEAVDRRDELDDEIAARVSVTENQMKMQCGGNTIVGKGFRRSTNDQKSKLKSLANFNCVIIEEADEVAEEDFIQLDDSLRTVKGDVTIVLLLNPPHRKHWIIRRWFNLTKSGVDGFYKADLKDSEKRDTIYIHGTYESNRQNIADKTIDNFERYKTRNPSHYYSMIKGLVSEGARGRVFTDWQTISVAEYEALEYERFYGLDFGFSNDPTALVEVMRHNERIYVRQLLYETGLTNARIAKRMEELGVNGLIFADASEPKSIAEIAEYNFDISAAPKGNDSIRTGIDYIHDHEVYYTEDSDDIADELQEYKWALDRNKEPTNTPVDAHNHAMDAIRYALAGRKSWVQPAEPRIRLM